MSASINTWGSLRRAAGYYQPLDEDPQPINNKQDSEPKKAIPIVFPSAPSVSPRALANVGVSKTLESNIPSLKEKNIQNWDSVKENLILTGKVVLVAILIAGLIAACVFSGGAAAGAAVAGAALFKVALLGSICTACGLSTLYAFLSAGLNRMFEVCKKDNGRDAAWFVLDTLAFTFMSLYYALIIAREIGIWDLLLNSKKN